MNDSKQCSCKNCELIREFKNTDWGDIIMPNKDAKNRKRKRILKNEQLKKDGRTPNQIARKKRRRNNVWFICIWYIKKRWLQS